MKTYCWGVIRGTSEYHWEDTTFLFGSEETIRQEVEKYIELVSESGLPKAEILMDGFSSLQEAKQDFFRSGAALYNNFDYKRIHLTKTGQQRAI